MDRHSARLGPARMDGAWSTLRTVLRRQVIAICAVAFLADIMSGMLGATFSLYAEDLGASVILIGVLTSLTGLTGLVSSVPVGVFSDRVGRGKVLAIGMIAFSGALALCAIAPSPLFLIPGRLMLGMAMVASFWIAAAYLGDIVTNSERGVAFGLLTTAMGLGFTVGPLLGGVISDATSMRGAYAAAAGIGLIGVWIVLSVLQQPGIRGGRQRRTRMSLRDSLRVGRDPALVAVGVANVLSGIIFGGAVATIFPLYAEDLGLTAGTIGTMFAVRALASTSVRLPSGALTGFLGSRQVVLGALVLETIAVAGIGTAESYGPLLLWLIVEGVGYGAFLASSQAYLAENTVEETRGAAIGLYSMTGGIGNTLAPLALGLVAAALGLDAVFFVAGGLTLVGIVAIGIVWLRIPARSGEHLKQANDGRELAQGGAGGGRR